jgi:hypothetical protein
LFFSPFGLATGMAIQFAYGHRVAVFFLVCGSLAGTRVFAEDTAPINRRALVTRHNPAIREIDKLSPLTIGNGKFAFTADVTGLQSFPEEYEAGIPLSTQSEWGWHSFPNPQGYELADALQNYDTYGRQVPYVSNQNRPAAIWLRANPHRLGLAQIGFEFTKKEGTKVVAKDLMAIEQTLDIWAGTLISKFEIEGETVTVRTCCHPDEDLLAISVESTLLKQDRLKVVLKFAYGSGEFGKAPEDWTKPEKHSTELIRHSRAGGNPGNVRLLRTLDSDSYVVDVLYDPSTLFNEVARNHFVLQPSSDARTFEFVVRFSPTASEIALPIVAETQIAAAKHWQEFWENGGAIELLGSADPRAQELERRIVLSQYLMAVNCAGNAPPQETGLTFNSWFGKSHLEMHWWHAVHWALWNRLDLLERSFAWYEKVLPLARATAKMQGYRGARWPKMVGPDGRESPSSVGVFLIWQQPHPIYYAELCYRQKPTHETLERYREIVYATADFMTSYAHWDERAKRFVLGPPLIPAQEHYDPRTTFNPPCELEYWHWALGVAREWRKRLGEQSDPDWDHVYKNISRLPVTDGVYDTAEGVWVDIDHPSHLMALGFLPGHLAEAPIMRRTLVKVMDTWKWDKTWAWDYPMTAMTAARIGEPETALDALLMDVPKNRYLVNGHNYQDDRLPIYLPGNGGLLAVTAMMAAGWDGAPERHAPGFPDNGKWQVRWEGLQKMP